MFGKKFRMNLKKPLYKIGSLIAKTGIDPNVFSLIAILWAFVAAYFLAIGNVIAALIFILLAAVWDSLDGSVARAMGKETKFGNYLDAIIDKYVEVIIYFGFALSGFFIETFLVMSGSLLISYAKARTAIVVPIDNHDWPAIGERLDRLMLLIIAIVISIFVPNITILDLTIPSISIFLYLIAIVVYIGSIQRIIYAKKIIDKSV
jgi:phosphatidylglycerophosphate synthase|tara:strand:- start:9128 stop:9742 length:615 start_codon:yes stop_codon:yes gene_type:complete